MISVFCVLLCPFPSEVNNSSKKCSDELLLARRPGRKAQRHRSPRPEQAAMNQKNIIGATAPAASSPALFVPPQVGQDWVGMCKWAHPGTGASRQETLLALSGKSFPMRQSVKPFITCFSQALRPLLSPRDVSAPVNQTFALSLCPC